MARRRGAAGSADRRARPGRHERRREPAAARIRLDGRAGRARQGQRAALRRRGDVPEQQLQLAVDGLVRLSRREVVELGQEAEKKADPLALLACAFACSIRA